MNGLRNGTTHDNNGDTSDAGKFSLDIRLVLVAYNKMGCMYYKMLCCNEWKIQVSRRSC